MVDQGFHRLVDARTRRRSDLLVLDAIVAFGHPVEDLADDLHRLANLVEANRIAVESVAVGADHHVEVDVVVVQVGLITSQVPLHTGRAQDRAGGAEGERLCWGDHTNTLETFAPDRLAGHQDVVLLQTFGEHVEQTQYVVTPPGRQVSSKAAGAHEVVVHPQAGDLLEEAQNLFALAPAVDHHRHSTKVHAIGCHEEQMAAHAVQLREQHAHPHGALGNVAVNAQQLLGGHREDEFVVEGAQVVHAGDVGAALHECELLTGLLHTGMQVADDRLAPQHRLALEFQHQAQHPMGGGVLRAHVDDHCLVFVTVVGEFAEFGGFGFAQAQHRTEFAHQFTRGDLRAWPHLLMSFGGQGAHVGAPLNCTGIAPAP